MNVLTVIVLGLTWEGVSMLSYGNMLIGTINMTWGGGGVYQLYLTLISLRFVNAL